MSSARCWREGADPTKPEEDSSRACGASDDANKHFSCCGAGDSCLEGNICHYTHPLDGGRGYYVAACTDPTFEDPSCSPHCASETHPDVTYNFTGQFFACCHSPDFNIGPDCDNPTKDTWSSPPPASLKVLLSIASTVTSGWRPSVTAEAQSSSSQSATALASSTGASGPESQTNPSASPNASASASGSASGLDSGSKVGIGVGIGLGIPLIALLITVLILYRRGSRRNQSTEAPWPEKRPEGAPAIQGSPHYGTPMEVHSETVHRPELHNQARLELPDQLRSEMQGRSRSEMA